MYRRIKSLEKLKYKARTGRLSGKMLDSGFYEDQTHGALQKAWVAYVISRKKDDPERKQYYAAVIQKLQGELGLTISDFPELRQMALDFLSLPQNRDLVDWASEEEVSGDEILDILIKGDNEFARKIKNEGSMTIKRGEQE
jgi:hypothetical protein